MFSLIKWCVLKFHSSLKPSRYSIEYSHLFFTSCNIFASKWFGFVWNVLTIFTQWSRVGEEQNLPKNKLLSVLQTRVSAFSVWNAYHHFTSIIYETQSPMQNISVEIMKPNKKCLMFFYFSFCWLIFEC